MSSAVSIIIPTYNRRELLIKTLQNIDLQTMKSYEVIIVDDHSTDGTLEFVKREYGKQIIALPSKGKGPGAARNTGMEVAGGQYIKFFDSDDLMTSNTLQVQCDALNSSTKGFIYSPYFYATQNESGQWRQADEAILNYFPFDSSKPLHYWMAVKNLFITIPGMMFKRELLQEVGAWRIDVTASEDWDYLWRISIVEPFPIHTNSCAFLYRIHGQQTTESNFSNDQRDQDKFRVLMDIYKRDIIANTSKISGWERTAFKNKFYHLSHVTHKDSALYKQLEPFRAWQNELIWYILRLDMKMGRTKTKTNWQPCHGPLKSNNKFLEYMNMII